MNYMLIDAPGYYGDEARIYLVSDDLTLLMGDARAEGYFWDGDQLPAAYSVIATDIEDYEAGDRLFRVNLQNGIYPYVQEADIESAIEEAIASYP